MGADLSRVRFDAFRDHSGVVMQQGRLLLDADWNEQVAIIDRRLRANAADLGSSGPDDGIAGTAVVPRTTPEGFKVTLTGGVLSIGRGRMYVDGLLAENHGTGVPDFDPLLAEPSLKLDTPYAKQHYWPTPVALPTAGTHLAYLDVWQREITPVEDPDLIEPAVGVDTTARTQTVWQVRLHPLGPGNSCATPDKDIPGWAALTAPSGGRLTTGTIPVTDDQDPCALPPAGGYRGLENQSYRVEIHTGGPVGTATFKWSRDNGSVVSPVVEVLPGGASVRPASLGKDAVLRFEDGDWVEILDKHREFNGQPGEMRKIDVHVEDGTIRFAPALPADLRLTPEQAADRHLRVRRWDQKGTIKSSAGKDLQDLDAGTAGVITVPGAAVVLEHGVTVKLATTGGDFLPGDHWIFAARTAATSVQELTDSPPLGIHHHYARLGTLTFPGAVTDCRSLWPPECNCDGGDCGDCTLCVTPESHASGALTIQDAVNEVSKTGGTVCLAVGLYHLGEGGVLIQDASSVTVRGQGPRTVITGRENGFRVLNSAFVTLEDFAVVSGGGRPCVALQATAAATVQRLTLLSLASLDATGPAIELSGVALRPTLRENIVVARLGIGVGDQEKTPLLTAELTIAGNVLICSDTGISLDGRTAHLFSNCVSGNTVLRAGTSGVRLLGAVGSGGTMDVADNTVLTGGAGIVVAAGGFTVRDNNVGGTEESLKQRGDGISVLPGFPRDGRGTVRITSNSVRDIGGRGIAVLAPVTSLEVVHNLIERTHHGIVMTERARAVTVVVTDNTVNDVGSRPTDESNGAIGIQIVGANRASVESNLINGVGTAREAGAPSAGIRLLACAESRVASNAVERIGVKESEAAGVGIAIQSLIARTQVSGNSSRRQPLDPDEDSLSLWIGLLIGTTIDKMGGLNLAGPPATSSLARTSRLPLASMRRSSQTRGRCRPSRSTQMWWAEAAANPRFSLQPRPRWSSPATTASSAPTPKPRPCTSSPQPQRSTPTGSAAENPPASSSWIRCGLRCSATCPVPGS
jgi:hypothetical protein